jgi:type I restriction enzyme S subunit
MRKYDSYKDSGVKWMGEIPCHWQAVRIKWLLNERIERSEDGKGTPLSMSQKYGLIPTSEMDTVPNLAANYIGAKRVYVNDLVFNKLKAHLGVFAISKNDGLVSPDYAVYTPTPRTFLPYLEYLFHTQLYISEFKKKTTGVAIGFTRLYTDGLFAIYSIYPPLEEQKSIVAYLNKKTAEIDEQVSKVEREIELLKEYKQAEIARVVTHGLNPNAPTKPSGISWIGDIPKHWSIRKLSQVATEYFVSNKSIHHQNLLSLSYGAIVRKDINTTEGLLPASFDTYQVVKKDIIVMRLTDLQNDHRSLRVGIAKEEGIVTSAYTSIKVRETILPNYLYYQLHTNDIHKVFYGMGDGLRQSLNFAGMKNLRLLLPPIEEQEEIVDYINRKTTEIDRLVVELTYQVEYLKEYKQRLIADVVTGKINVQPN